MSRRINPESELSADEVEYLEARGQHNLLAANAAWLILREAETSADVSNFPPVVNPAGEGADDAQHEGGAGGGDDNGDANTENKPNGAGLYATLKGDELRAEIARRNGEREGTDEALVKPEGTKNEDLVAALEADDARALASE